MSAVLSGNPVALEKWTSLRTGFTRRSKTTGMPYSLLGDQPPPSASEAYLGLARSFYEWDDLDAAQEYADQSLQLARQYGRLIDRFVVGQVFMARLKLARRDVAGSVAVLAEAEQSVRQNSFVHRMPEVAAAQVLSLLRQGNLSAAASLHRTHDLPISRARVLLAQGRPVHCAGGARAVSTADGRQRLGRRVSQDNGSLRRSPCTLTAKGRRPRRYWVEALALGEALAVSSVSL